MQTKNPARKAELQAQLKEVELQLKTLQQQFRDIEKRTRTSVSTARKCSDARRLSEIRKQLGLE